MESGKWKISIFFLTATINSRFNPLQKITLLFLFGTMMVQGCKQNHDFDSKIWKSKPVDFFADDYRERMTND